MYVEPTQAVHLLGPGETTMVLSKAVEMCVVHYSEATNPRVKMEDFQRMTEAPWMVGMYRGVRTLK